MSYKFWIGPEAHPMATIDPENLKWWCASICLLVAIRTLRGMQRR